ncbi:MAG: ComF family protein [Treponema sp.]|nr:ComF family protein [Treponema sp.]
MSRPIPPERVRRDSLRPGRVAAALREGLFPRGCALCGKALAAAEAFYGLCGPCGERCRPPPDFAAGRCSLCGQPLISEAGTCLSCRNGPPRSFDRALSLFPYAGKYRTLLRAYKFGGRPELGNFFTKALERGMAALGTENPAWVPVPPRPGKIKESGWDQIEYLARILEQNRRSGGAGAFPVRRCLRRLPSESQKELDREERRRNLQGRIVPAGRNPVLPRPARFPAFPPTAVVFDDVYTTGSTLDACAGALKSAGVERVYGICLCYD